MKEEKVAKEEENLAGPTHWKLKPWRGEPALHMRCSTGPGMRMNYSETVLFDLMHNSRYGKQMAARLLHTSQNLCSK
ncbi:hypothetical protein NQZ68_025213 [Dissostichus eleginoides]|nr:hypothetical protein NQZ68_025213 [Dissostichus eleginoides]